MPPSTIARLQIGPMPLYLESGGSAAQEIFLYKITVVFCGPKNVVMLCICIMHMTRNLPLCIHDKLGGVTTSRMLEVGLKNRWEVEGRMGGGGLSKLVGGWPPKQMKLLLHPS